MHRMNWRYIFNNNTPKLLSLLDLLADRLHASTPSVLAHLHQQDLSLAACFSPIFLTLCIYHLPLPFATRIFECFLAEGEGILVRMVLRLVEINRNKILGL